METHIYCVHTHTQTRTRVNWQCGWRWQDKSKWATAWRKRDWITHAFNCARTQRVLNRGAEFTAEKKQKTMFYCSVQAWNWAVKSTAKSSLLTLTASPKICLFASGTPRTFPPWKKRRLVGNLQWDFFFFCFRQVFQQLPNVTPAISACFHYCLSWSKPSDWPERMAITAFTQTTHG